MNHPIDLVRLLYQFDPKIEDSRVIATVRAVFDKMPSVKTLSVWKARLRKEGIDIPDRRKNEQEG